MRRLLLAVALLTTSISAANAKCCYGDKYLGGYVKNNEERSFSLCPGSTIIGVTADNDNHKLSMTVSKPSGSEVCDKGPSNSLTCAFEVRDKGTYTIIVRNKTSNADGVSYQLSCRDE